jgi:K+-transporting ATPase KdpF subunit
MSIPYIIAGTLVLAILLYLIVALLKPEMFE